jgi:hypothetical protein
LRTTSRPVVNLEGNSNEHRRDRPAHRHLERRSDALAASASPSSTSTSPPCAASSMRTGPRRPPAASTSPRSIRPTRSRRAPQGPDFFDVETHPEITVEATSITATGDTCEITGDLTREGSGRHRSTVAPCRSCPARSSSSAADRCTSSSRGGPRRAALRFGDGLLYEGPIARADPAWLFAGCGGWDVTVPASYHAALEVTIAALAAETGGPLDARSADRTSRAPSSASWRAARTAFRDRARSPPGWLSGRPTDVHGSPISGHGPCPARA